MPASQTSATAGAGGAAPAQSPSVSPAQTSPTAASRPDGGDLVGRAVVVDGDTIRVGGESVRFNGVDAPESRQTCTNESGASYRCGATAAQALDEYLAASRPVRCTFLYRDQYRRVVGDCFRADGGNVAEWLVRNGHALDWPRYSKGRYAAQQSAAERAKVGMWRGAFQNPWDWRAAHR
ncbi:MAG: thermonuclease family protein [Beijerinckiaceae bacterium]|nr:thermonuclease family protein [Beijerinckiaceae bacterium]